MRRITTLAAALLLAGATAASAQMGMGPQKITLAAGLQRAYNSIKANLTEAAEKMPESNYAFKPTPEIREFGQLFGHVANAMYGACAAVKGDANPNQGNDLEKKAAVKADVVKFLGEAFTYCDGAFSSLTDDNAMQMVKQGQNQVARALVLASLVAHNNEMYGTTAVYLRLKGIVPPSTERMQRRPAAK